MSALGPVAAWPRQLGILLVRAYQVALSPIFGGH